MSHNGLIARLEDIQQAHGWTDQEMADRLGIHRTFWTLTRSGQRRPGTKFLRGVISAFPELTAEAISYLEAVA